MRLLTAFLLLLTFVTASFGQIKYEKGYFINNDNKRIECLIKNKDWKNNPTEFSYKLVDSSAPQDGNLSSVKEFGIYNFSKYINADVKIDRSKLQATELVGNENPLWSQEKLFLKVLLEGKANLYCYDDGNGRRFFYSVNDSAIQQLVYKRFRMNFTEKITQGDQPSPITKSTYGSQLSPIAENNTYKDQLLRDLSCPNSILESVEDLNYKTEDIERYFNSYNRCVGDTKIEISHKTKNSYFNLKFTPGINSSAVSMSITDIHNNPPDFVFKKNLSFRLGLEFESILPFNRNKWALVFEPTFQSYNSETENGFNGIFTIKFKSIEFPIGMRYYFYLNEHTKFFLNGFYITQATFNFNSKLAILPNKTFNVDPAPSFSFGGGLEYKRLSIETRYYTDRNMLHYRDLYADYSRLSFIFGYKIIKGKH